jgi:hypothetical protein
VPFQLVSDVFGRRIVLFGRALKPLTPEQEKLNAPDWMQARPLEIRRSLDRVQQLPSGGWYVLDASYRIGEQPAFYWVEGRELVAWRVGGVVHAGPNACPHRSRRGGCATASWSARGTASR